MREKAIRFWNIYVLMLLVLGIVSSCVKDIDTGQIDDFSATPIVESSLLRLEVSDSIVDLLPLNTAVKDSLLYEGFRNNVITDHLTKADLYFEFVNTTAKPYNIVIQFVDGTDQVLDSQNFNVSGAVSGEVIVNRTVEYTGNKLNVITDTQKIRFVAEALAKPNSVLPDPKLIFKCSGKMYLLVE